VSLHDGAVLEFMEFLYVAVQDEGPAVPEVEAVHRFEEEGLVLEEIVVRAAGAGVEIGDDDDPGRSRDREPRRPGHHFPQGFREIGLLHGHEVKRRIPSFPSGIDENTVKSPALALSAPRPPPS